MARLGDLFDGIETRLTASLKASGDKIPTYGRGMAAAAAFKSKPSITFVPLKGNGVKPRAMGTPPALWERSLQIAVRVYEEDIDECNALAERLTEAIDDGYAGNYSLEGEEWDTSRKVAQGMVLDVIYRFAVRFERRPLLIVVPTTMQETGSIVTELTS